MVMTDNKHRGSTLDSFLEEQGLLTDMGNRFVQIRKAFEMKDGAGDFAIAVESLSQADGDGWIARVPSLPGCMGDGETPEEALANAERAIEEWLDAAKALDRDLPSAN